MKYNDVLNIYEVSFFSYIPSAFCVLSNFYLPQGIGEYKGF